MKKAERRGYKIIASRISFREETTDPKGPLPEIGQHTMDVLDQVGIDEETREKYLAAGVIGQHEG